MVWSPPGPLGLFKFAVRKFAHRKVRSGKALRLAASRDVATGKCPAPAAAGPLTSPEVGDAQWLKYDLSDSVLSILSNSGDDGS